MSNFQYELTGNFDYDSAVVEEFMDFLKNLKARAFISSIYSSEEQTFDDIKESFQEQSGINVSYPKGTKTIQFNPSTNVISKLYTKIENSDVLVEFDDNEEHHVYPIYSKHFVADTADNFELLDLTDIPDFDGGIILMNLRGAKAAAPEPVWLNLNLLATDYANFQAATLDTGATSGLFERQANRFIPSSEVPQAQANRGYFTASFMLCMGLGRSDVTSAGVGLANHIISNSLTAAGTGELGKTLTGFATNTPQVIDRFHWRNSAGATGLGKGSKVTILGFK